MTKPIFKMELIDSTVTPYKVIEVVYQMIYRGDCINIAIEAIERTKKKA